MPRNDQTSAVLDSWIEAQRRMWEAWAEATRSAASGASQTPPFDESVAEQWRHLVGLAVKTWMDEAVPLARAAAESLAQGSERMVEMLELSMRAWRASLPGEGGNWEGMTEGLVDQLTQLLLRGPFEPLAQSSQVTELWRLWFDELAKMQRLWFEELMGVDGVVEEGALAEPTVLRTFNDRYWDTWERTFGRLLESPNVGHTRELTQKSTKAMRAWVRFRRAATEYQLVLGEALGQAWTAFVAELVALIEKGETPRTGGGVLRLWGTTADRVLTEIMGHEPYARAQGELVNAAMGYRIAEREMVDMFLQMSHVPSRTELDEANRNIQELRRQVRELRRTVKRLTAATTAPAPAPPAQSPKDGEAT